MSRLATLACAGGCGAPVRTSGRWAVCRSCSTLAMDFVSREVGTRDPNAWVRASNVVMGNRRVFRAVVALVRAEQPALAGVA